MHGTTYIKGLSNFDSVYFLRTLGKLYRNKHLPCDTTSDPMLSVCLMNIECIAERGVVLSSRYSLLSLFLIIDIPMFHSSVIRLFWHVSQIVEGQSSVGKMFI